MQYIPHTLEEKAEILRTIGVQRFEELLKDIPRELIVRELDLAPGISEVELLNAMKAKADKNIPKGRRPVFLGGGVYDHYIPPVVDELASRTEFVTAYTPYQGEASQGALQSIYEFQSHISILTKMEVANASMYDGAQALAEAAFMILREKNSRQIIVPDTIHPETFETLKTYLANLNIEWVVIPSKEGVLDIDAYSNALSKETAFVIFQTPNFLGFLEDGREITRLAKERGAAVIACVNPASLSVLEAPGEWGADVVVGEGQSLGNPMSYGGPHFGFFAVTKEYMRKIPGRVVGMTRDLEGKRAFVLTLQAREQHIRREKATSNICTNHALSALRATIFLSVLGRNGFRKMGELNVERSRMAYEELTQLKGVRAFSEAAFFNEFTLRIDKNPLRLEKSFLKHNLIGPLHLARFRSEWQSCYLLAVTEKRTPEEIQALVQAIREA